MNANTQPTQANVILAELEKHIGQWVPMPHLANVSGAYAVHSRIAELRPRIRLEGKTIYHRNEQSGRKKQSFYRLAAF